MYTRKGDRGETSLFGPTRVPKDSVLVEAYGTIDELNSVIGAVIADSPDRAVSSQLGAIQGMLFVAGADAASGFPAGKVPRIAPVDTSRIERLTDDLLEKLPSLRNFIVPGGSRTGAQLQVARAVCRRAERRMVSASKTYQINPELIPFLNRLSSYLFNLSRMANKRAGKKETVWKGPTSPDSRRRS